MKKSAVKISLVVIAVIALITLMNGWGGIIAAAKEITAFAIFWGIVALACYGLYKLLKKFSKEPKDVDTELK
jgi:hypothetical protein